MGETSLDTCVCDGGRKWGEWLRTGTKDSSRHYGLLEQFVSDSRSINVNMLSHEKSMSGLEYELEDLIAWRVPFVEQDSWYPLSDFEELARDAFTEASDEILARLEVLVGKVREYTWRSWGWCEGMTWADFRYAEN